MTTAEPRLIHDPEGLNTAVWPVRPEHFVTPVDAFFTRNHASIPRVDAKAWRLEVDGLVDRPRSFSLEELFQAFPRRRVTATLVCAGLRRDEFLSLGPLPGELPWGPEPASTGRWSGVALGDLLRTVGVGGQAHHVEFVGLDQVERHGRQFGFGGSIDLEKALNEEVLLADELNGAPLPVIHGAPLRTVVPGWIGARSVKWLGRITLREKPSENYFQARAYRVQREINPSDPRDVSAGVALSEVPLNAVILDPTPNRIVRSGRLPVRGWAMGSAGAPIAAVEVSPDAGRQWTEARVSGREGRWAWTFWEAVVELVPGDHTLVVRATDGTGTTQPAAVSATWNVKGYNNNAWHRVTVRAE